MHLLCYFNAESIRSGSVKLALTIVCGAYQSSLLAYFMYSDLFTSLATYITTTKSHSEILRASVLLALLSTYNKYETANPYQSRLRDSVNESLMSKIIDQVGAVARTSQESYINVQDDAVDGLLGGVTRLVGGYVPVGFVTRLGIVAKPTPTQFVGDVDDALAKLSPRWKMKADLDQIPRQRYCSWHMNSLRRIKHSHSLFYEQRPMTISPLLDPSFPWRLISPPSNPDRNDQCCMPDWRY